MHLADSVPADDPDPGHEPVPRAERPPTDQTLGAATNERLLELLQAIDERVEALHEGQQRLLSTLAPD